MKLTYRSFGLITGLLILAAPAFADTVGVSQCSRDDGGVFHPGLLTVEEDGTRTFYPVGENGLTDSIVFSRTDAFNWVEALGVFADDTVYNNYAGFVCGLPCEDCEEPEEAQEPEDPQDEPIDEPTEESEG